MFRLPVGSTPIHSSRHHSSPLGASPLSASPLLVLTLTPFFPSDRNEVNGCFVAEPVELFKEFGVESSVIAVSPIYKPRKHPIAAAPAEWVRYPQLPGNFGLSSAGKALYARLLESIRRRQREAERERVRPIDIIHAHAALPCGHAAMLLSKRLNIPFVVTVHGRDVFNTCQLAGAPADWRRKVSTEVYRAARTVICISGKVHEILKNDTASEVSSIVIYNGVDANLFSPAPPKKEELVAGIPEPDEQEILVVGTLLPSKGQDLVLRAMASLTSVYPTLRCRIIGEGSYRAELEALASQLGLRSRVQFLGRQSRTEVAAAMQRCSVFALPSRNEGLGCVYLEAMACAKPVIGCAGQGIEEVIEHGNNGWLVSPNGLDELVAVLTATLRSPELSGRVGTAARETILKKLTLRHQAMLLIDVYRKAIA